MLALFDIQIKSEEIHVHKIIILHHKPWTFRINTNANIALSKAREFEEG